MPEARRPDGSPRAFAPVRVGVWVGHLALPLLGLWLLVAQPTLDLLWEHHPTHFALVLAVALISVGLAVLVNRPAVHRGDARLFLVGLAFFAAAGFLGVHALATPAVLLNVRTAAFVLATPIGLCIAALFAMASSASFSPERSAALLRRRRWLRGGLVALVIASAVGSLLALPPFGTLVTADGAGVASGGLDEATGQQLVWILATVSVLCYGVAAIRYWLVYRRRPAVMLLSVVTAFALLAEASIANALARNWHLSWWTWHVLMAAGFGFVAYSAYVQYQREGRAAGLFESVGTQHTVAEVREEYGTALEQLVGAMGRLEHGNHDPDVELITVGLGNRFGLTDGQTAVLGRAAEALAADRQQIRRLNTLVGVGRECRVIVSEPALLRAAIRSVWTGFGPDAVRIGLLREGRLEFPTELGADPRAAREAGFDSLTPTALTTLECAVSGGLAALPLTVKDRAAGVIEVRRPAGDFAERELSVLRSLASQLSIGLENARLYQQIDQLFRQYMSPDVATALLADPAQAALGGAVVEVTALFADLRGFTTFSERVTPEEIVVMLNRYFEVATRCILEQGGTVVQFVGDALMALFNAPVRQPDHARRAALAALWMQYAIEPIRAERPDWPRFRVGINTGPALVGNIGSEALRNFNAMGDAVNVAARLETIAEPGTVVIGSATRAAIGPAAAVRPLGELMVKGREQPVDAYQLLHLDTERVDAR